MSAPHPRNSRQGFEGLLGSSGDTASRAALTRCKSSSLLVPSTSPLRLSSLPPVVFAFNTHCNVLSYLQHLYALSRISVSRKWRILEAVRKVSSLLTCLHCLGHFGVLLEVNFASSTSFDTFSCFCSRSQPFPVIFNALRVRPYRRRIHKVPRAIHLIDNSYVTRQLHRQSGHQTTTLRLCYILATMSTCFEYAHVHSSPLRVRGVSERLWLLRA